MVESTSCESISAYTYNWRVRAIGINIQGLADTMTSLGMAMDSRRAKKLNRTIAETVYYAALEASCELAEREGRCSGWDDSPGAEGWLQYDFWGVTPTDGLNWAVLKNHIRKHGLRNMLLVSLSPTPSQYNITGVSAGTHPLLR